MTTIKSMMAAMAAACLAAACAEVQGTEVKPARPVKVQAATAAAPADGVRYSAAIEPFEQVSVAFKASGYVDDVLRRPGVDGRLRTAQPSSKPRSWRLGRHSPNSPDALKQEKASLARGK